jgi:arylsulfatase A-like enzyme
MSVAGAAQPAEVPAKRPNIVLILADDMGYSDLGCYGSEIDTPHLDGLAARGTRLTQMYNAARCCPTRASLLTGLYPHQVGVGHMVDDLGLDPYQGYLNDRCVTIAEALRAAGYATYMSGKWHVGGRLRQARSDSRAGTPRFPRPIDRGFDHHFGTLAGAGSYFDPTLLVRDAEFITPGEDFYYTDAIGEEAVRMISEGGRTGKPFFLHVAFTAPHFPLHALEEDVARYRGRYRAGWDTLRAERSERQRAPRLSPRDPKAPAWEDVADKEWEDHRMAVYAAQIDRMDQNVGRILAALRETGAEDNTLVLFLSDNGGSAEYQPPGDMTNLPPLPNGTPVRRGNLPENTPGGPETWMSYDLPWANLSNTPFRRYKHYAHEGGISTPLIAVWPGLIPAGGVGHAPGHVVDVLPTCLEAVGAAYPDEYDGRAILPVEGESLLPLLRGESWSRERALVWEHEGNRAVRLGDLKLVSAHPGPWELYDMTADRAELQDLAGQRSDQLPALVAAYDTWSARAGVLPWDGVRDRSPKFNRAVPSGDT